MEQFKKKCSICENHHKAWVKHQGKDRKSINSSRINNHKFDMHGIPFHLKLKKQEKPH